eukprot:6195848-Pleurochrysis_carterae.AAC.1
MKLHAAARAHAPARPDPATETHDRHSSSELIEASHTPRPNKGVSTKSEIRAMTSDRRPPSQSAACPQVAVHDL